MLICVYITCQHYSSVACMFYNILIQFHLFFVYIDVPQVYIQMYHMVYIQMSHRSIYRCTTWSIYRCTTCLYIDVPQVYIQMYHVSIYRCTTGLYIDVPHVYIQMYHMSIYRCTACLLLATRGNIVISTSIFAPKVAVCMYKIASVWFFLSCSHNHPQCLWIHTNYVNDFATHLQHDVPAVRSATVMFSFLKAVFFHCG